MAAFDRSTLKNLTQLCRIDCTEEEEEALLADLQSILGYFEQLQEVDTQNVKPRYQVLDNMANVMREDVIGETMTREVFLSNAPAQIGGMIKVPPVLKQSK